MAAECGNGTVLVVDDSPAIADTFARFLTDKGFDVRRANGGEAALAAMPTERPDVVMLDVVMPGIDGFEVCRRLKASPETRLVPVMLVTGLDGQDDRIRGVEVGADAFLVKPPDWPELTARMKALVRLKRYTDDLESAESVILSLAMTIEVRDPYTEGHCQRLANYATSLGERLGLPESDLEALYRGGFLHDLGKIGIPDAVLLKPGPLTPAEFDLVKQHPVIGAQLCDGLRSLHLVRPIIRYHHERLDGSGYPAGLSGDNIPLLAQITSIVDVYDALATKRPYKRAYSRAEVHELLLAEVAQGWRNRDVVHEFIAMDHEGAPAWNNNDWMLRMRFSREATSAFPAGIQARAAVGPAGATDPTPGVPDAVR
jgi:putative two-component system response regulator